MFVKGILVGILLLLMESSAIAEDPIHFSGFGTLAIDQNNNRGIDYISTVQENTGVGYTTRRSAETDSLFGVQADSNLSTSIHATVQVVSRQQSDGSATPYIEWANLQYHPLPNLMLRFGRLATNSLLMSESREIGYSRLSLHLPDTYLSNPLAYINGADLTWHLHEGDWLWHINLDSGIQNQSIFDYTEAVTQYHFHTNGLSLSLDRGFQNWRVAYSRTQISANSNLLDNFHAALSELAASGVSSASMINAQTPSQGITADFLDLAYTLRNDPWLLQAEYVNRRLNTALIQDVRGYNMLLGWTWKNLTPYVMYTRYWNINSYQLPGLISSSQASVVAQINAIDTLLDAPINQANLSFGLRYDLQANIDFKLEIDHISKPAGSESAYANPTPSFIASAQSFNVIAVGMDFIF